MSRLSRTSLFAIAATAAIAISALTPTNASAWGRGVGFHAGFRGFHFGYHGGFYRHFPYRFGHWGFGRYHFGYGYRWWPRYGCWRFGWCYPHPRPIVYGALGAGAVAATVPAAAPVATPPAQPNCLVKQYLPNGAVEFADVCTQEQAVAMPNGAPNAMPMQPPGQPGLGPQ